MSERKFVFDWDASVEDTSGPPLPTASHASQGKGGGEDQGGIRLLFGRGLMAGLDVKEQRKAANAFYEPLLRQRRTAEENDRLG